MLDDHYTMKEAYGIRAVSIQASVLRGLDFRRLTS